MNTHERRLGANFEPTSEIEVHARLAIGFQIDGARQTLGDSNELIEKTISKTVAL